MSFDKQTVLERILEEAPIQSNRRGEVEIDGEADGVKQKVKTPIYAYYLNGGFEDPELTYDKVNSPIRTTPDSTLAEIYSFWEEGPSAQDLRQRQEEEGDIGKGEVIYQGPVIKNISFINLKEEIERETRRQCCRFSFDSSATEFAEHFNNIVEELDYDLRFIDLRNENDEFFDFGAYAVQSPRMISYSLNGEPRKGLLNRRVPVSLNLDKKDPTLSEILEIIDESYQKIHNSDLSNSTIYLQES